MSYIVAYITLSVLHSITVCKPLCSFYVSVKRLIAPEFSFHRLCYNIMLRGWYSSGFVAHVDLLTSPQLLKSRRPSALCDRFSVHGCSSAPIQLDLQYKRLKFKRLVFGLNWVAHDWVYSVCVCVETTKTPIYLRFQIRFSINNGFSHFVCFTCILSICLQLLINVMQIFQLYLVLIYKAHHVILIWCHYFMISSY